MNIHQMCFQDEEMVQHLFSGCKVIKQIREYMHDKVQRDCVPSLRYK
jgi:hypothetical protein